MPLDVKCPGCNAAFKVKDEHAGKKMKCPKCSKIVPIPKPDDDVVAEVEVVEDDLAAAPAEGDPFDFYSDEGKPKKKEGGVKSNEPARPRGPTWGKYVPCPSCGGREAKKVKWTWWGSFYGPRLCNHVRCIDCGHCFNGKTGDTNVIPAILFVTVPLVLIILLSIFIYIALVRADYWPPWKHLFPS